jgi:hypothetical protein
VVRSRTIVSAVVHGLELLVLNMATNVVRLIRLGGKFYTIFSLSLEYPGN